MKFTTCKFFKGALKVAIPHSSWVLSGPHLLLWRRVSVLEGQLPPRDGYQEAIKTSPIWFLFFPSLLLAEKEALEVLQVSAYTAGLFLLLGGRVPPSLVLPRLGSPTLESWRRIQINLYLIKTYQERAVSHWFLPSLSSFEVGHVAMAISLFSAARNQL